MADSLEGLDGLDLFNFEADWITEPNKKKMIQLSVNVYDGTVHSLDFFRSPIKKLSFQITDTETKLYSFLIFFADMIGRYKKFWMPDLFSEFTVKEFVIDTAQRVRVKKLSNLAMHGKERIFFKLYNGDRITERIDSFSQGTDYTELVLHALIPVFSIEEIQICTLLFLGRLDQDAIDIQYQNDSAASVKMEFIELLEEYS